MDKDKDKDMDNIYMAKYARKIVHYRNKYTSENTIIKRNVLIYTVYGVLPYVQNWNMKNVSG